VQFTAAETLSSSVESMMGWSVADWFADAVCLNSDTDAACAPPVAGS